MAIKITLKNSLPLDVLEGEIKKLDLKKALSGQIMIFDHRDMDIVLDEKGGKITAYAKGDFSDLVYGSQNRFFKFLFKKGILIPESIKGTNVFGAFSCMYPTDSEFDNLTEVVLYNISNFIQEERDYMKTFEIVDGAEDERLVDPSDEDSTELGEVPQETSKGTLQPGYPGYYYGLAGMYRY
jgi:hypothetical protein